MNRDNDRQTSIILSMIGILPVVWLGLLIAPSVKGGLPEILPSLMNVMSDPFHIELCDDSVKLSSFCSSAMEWASASISQHAETTDAGRNTAVRNGATQKPWTRNTGRTHHPKTS